MSPWIRYNCIEPICIEGVCSSSTFQSSGCMVGQALGCTILRELLCQSLKKALNFSFETNLQKPQSLLLRIANIKSYKFLRGQLPVLLRLVEDLVTLDVDCLTSLQL